MKPLFNSATVSILILLVGLVADTSARGNRHWFRSWENDDDASVPTSVEKKTDVSAKLTDVSVGKASEEEGGDSKRSRAKEREKRSE